ncbi:hypothetical protein GCM10028784_20790 [Myceligenerans cantabricum]
MRTPGEGSGDDEFIATVGHDLRSPLTPVLGYAQLLAAGPLTDEQRRYVEVIERNGRRLLRLIDELVVSMEISAGRLDVARRDVDLARVVRTCCVGLDQAARAAGVSLTVTAPGPAPVQGDQGLLAQVVESLVGRAIKLTPRGGAVTVRAGGRDGAPEAVLEVADTGPGLGPGELARLEETFGRTRDAAGRPAGGVGFGLPVAHAVVEAHGGTLGVDSAPDQGTTVTVTVPTGSSSPTGSSAGAGSTPR